MKDIALVLVGRGTEGRYSAKGLDTIPTLCPRKSVIPRTKVNQGYTPSLPQEIRFHRAARRNPIPGAEAEPAAAERPTGPAKAVGRNLALWVPPWDGGRALREAGWE